MVEISVLLLKTTLTSGKSILSAWLTSRLLGLGCSLLGVLTLLLYRFLARGPGVLCPVHIWTRLRALSCDITSDVV